MIQQKLLPIKLEKSDEEVTSRSGLILFDEFIKAFGLKGGLARRMPLPGSNRGFEAWRYIEPLVLMLYGGGRHIEDLRELREDRALMGATQMGEIPSSSAYGDWLLRMGDGQGLVLFHRVIDELTRKVLRRDEHKEYTLWSDPTIIEADKHEAVMSYQGVKGVSAYCNCLQGDAGGCVASVSAGQCHGWGTGCPQGGLPVIAIGQEDKACGSGQ